jgi:transcriptional regulator with GAF, ATPase, and Fis domain
MATGITLDDNDYTLTSPLASMAQAGPPLLCLTIVWHPDRERVGEQCIATTDVLELSRYLPLFQRPGQAQTAIGYSGVSRESLQIVRDRDDTLHIRPPGSRMAVELNGVAINGPVTLTRDQVSAGAMLGLGRAVLVCLHWMRCLPKDNPVPGLFGVGGAAVTTRDLVRQVASTDAPVLLLGETGTGKEVVARAIHALSRRAAKPLVTVNMATLNEALAAADLFGAAKGAYTGAQVARGGLFAEAQDATLFLDEIGNTPASVQPMLLRVLETGDYRPLGASADLHSSARLIAATDQDLYDPSFNQALLRRLESFVIQMPPLRARREDIGLLLLLVLDEQGAPDFPPELVSRLANYDWPGNVRQLKHVAKRCVMALQAGSVPDLEGLLAARPVGASYVSSVSYPASATAATATARPKKLAEVSEASVLAAMDDNAWQILGAAQALGVSRPSMYKLLESHSQIRRAEQIPATEISAALERAAGDVDDCARQLRTPSEALRRHLRALGLLA